MCSWLLSNIDWESVASGLFLRGNQECAFRFPRKNETEVKLVNEVCLFFLLEFAFTFSCLCWLYGKYITSSLVYNLGYWVWMAGFGCLKKWIIWWCVCLVVVLMYVYFTAIRINTRHKHTVTAFRHVRCIWNTCNLNPLVFDVVVIG